jgi:hypothetical protein
MATPSLPWYNKIKSIIAPTEGAANLALIVIILVCILVLWKGDSIKKAALAVWIVSP